jgi:hypothetical protein
MPFKAKPLRADVRALYLDNLARNVFEELARGGDEGLRLIERSWPDLARVLEAWSRTYATPVFEPSEPAASAAGRR